MMLLGLRLLNGVSFDDFQQRFNCDLRDVFGREIQDLTRRNLIEQTETHVRLSRLGLDLANLVFMAFI